MSCAQRLRCFCGKWQRSDIQQVSGAWSSCRSLLFGFLLMLFSQTAYRSRSCVIGNRAIKFRAFSSILHTWAEVSVETVFCSHQWASATFRVLWDNCVLLKTSFLMWVLADVGFDAHQKEPWVAHRWNTQTHCRKPELESNSKPAPPQHTMKHGSW